jgi:hypothetical protein
MVDFPAPLGPTTAVMPPAGMSMLPASVVAIVASVLIALGEHVELLMAGVVFGGCCGGDGVSCVVDAFGWGA